MALAQRTDANGSDTPHAAESSARKQVDRNGARAATQGDSELPTRATLQENTFLKRHAGYAILKTLSDDRGNRLP